MTPDDRSKIKKAGYTYIDSAIKESAASEPNTRSSENAFHEKLKAAGFEHQHNHGGYGGDEAVYHHRDSKASIHVGILGGSAKKPYFLAKTNRKMSGEGTQHSNVEDAIRRARPSIKENTVSLLEDYTTTKDNPRTMKEGSKMKTYSQITESFKTKHIVAYNDASTGGTVTVHNADSSEEASKIHDNLKQNKHVHNLKTGIKHSKDMKTHMLLLHHMDKTGTYKHKMSR